MAVNGLLVDWRSAGASSPDLRPSVLFSLSLFLPHSLFLSLFHSTTHTQASEVESTEEAAAAVIFKNETYVIFKVIMDDVFGFLFFF